MKFQSLPSLEETIFKTGNNGEYSLKKFAIPVKGESLTLNGFLTTAKNRSNYFFDSVHPKRRIVLHFTAGNIRSDLSALTTDNRHVSVAFVIGRNGCIYQLFPSKFWSGHIGKGLGNTNTGNAEDKLSIGIELSNYGYLTEKEGNLETFYSRQKDSNGKIGPVDVFCSLDDKEAYQKLSTPFRQQSYYASFTETQYESLIILLRYLTAQYAIPRQFFPESKRYETTPDVLNFKGIVSHVNYRSDGKWDIGPAFDWKTLIENVQAPAFKPQFERPQIAEGMRGMESIGPRLSSEDEMEEFLPQAKDPSHENEAYEGEM